MANITFDTNKFTEFPDEALGIGISTYGHSIVRTDAQKDVLRRHGHRAYRLPIQWNNGNPISSARGGPSDVSADRWVDEIHAIGGEVYMQIGGKDFDNDFNEDDAANLVRRYAPRGVTMFGVGNEPNNGGWDLNRTADLFNRCAPEMRAVGFEVGVDIKIGGLVWSYYDRGRNQEFLDRCGQHLDILEWHNYGMGNPPAQSDREALDSTPNWGKQVREVLEDASARSLDIIPLIGEINWAWQYKDGYEGTDDGSDTRFFDPIITVWMASIFGHALEAGGWPWQYSDQNGPLGITVEGGNTDQGRPSNTPQPVYHGVGAWTGEGNFPGAVGKIYKAGTDDGGLEAFAVNNTDGGMNLIIINKTTDRSIDFRVDVDDSHNGVSYNIFRSQDDAYADLASSGQATVHNGEITGSVPATRLIVLSFATTPATPPTGPSEPVVIQVADIYSDADDVGGSISTFGDPIRRNAGEQSYQSWEAPSGDTLSGGNFATRPPLDYVVDLGNGDDIAPLFSSEVWGPQTWTLSVPAGTDGVEVGLVVMEQFSDAQSVGARLFDINVTFGSSSVDYEDVDVFDEFGDQPGVLTLTVVPDTVDTTTVQVTLSPGSKLDNPFINGISIQPLQVAEDTDLFDPLPSNASLDEVVDKVNDILAYLESEE